MSQETHNGRLIAGRYRLGGRIGRGGMGSVWRATDELLGREVAVKELHLGANEPAAAALREARAVAQIKHPQVIVLHDVVVDADEVPYIVMELVVGGSLADRLTAQGPVGVGEAARIGLALLGALGAAHARGVLHRDIKPANILLEEGGRVVLTDFGIAQLAGSTTITETGAFVGSPEYTAPERMQGAKAGPEADLWSLGALLCAALSGRTPFHRDSLGGVLHAVVADEIRPPAEAGPLLPVVRGLLERDPARRLNVADAERLLRPYAGMGAAPVTPVPAPDTATQRLAVSVAPAPSPSPPTPSQPRSRRSVRIAVVAVAVLVLAGAGIALTVLRNGDSTGKDGGTDNRAGQSSTSAPSVTRSASASPTPTPTPTPKPSQKTTPSSDPSNTGYRTAADPAGFSVTVPTDSARSTDGKRVYYTTPDKAFYLGVLKDASTGTSPLDTATFANSGGPDLNPGYRDGKVVATKHNGHAAALRDYTWDGEARTDGPVHVYELSWDEGGQSYSVWFQGPLSKVTDTKRYFDTAVDSFTVSH
ncbi:serine/threonine-protein kinase [Streptomyces sp. NBC_01465]|uniref:serine/threonine-protein kinase n=1 Tax=Streptomyces sp. NBC_01465 TaxID=2903878 RepID=UPI002E359768|nr:serine/threonine-protein kinase [Streptomyces sp. NBC_01465]